MRAFSGSSSVLVLALAGCALPSSVTPMGDAGPPVGDAGTLAPDASLPPDGGRPAELHAELARLGPSAGGWFGALAVTSGGAFVVTRAGIFRVVDEGATRVPSPEGCAVPAWLGARGDELFVYCGDRWSRSLDDATTWADLETSATPRELIVAAGAHLALTGPDGQPLLFAPESSTFEPLPSTGFVHDARTLALEGSTLYALGSRFGMQIDLSAASPEWTNIRGLSGSYGSLRFGFGEGEGFATTENGGGPVFLLRREETGVWELLLESAGEASTFGREVADILVAHGRVYIAASDGLSVSSDRGATWERVLDTPFASEGALARVGEDVLAASSDGLFRERLARDGSRGWERLPLYLEPLIALERVGGSVLGVRRDREGFSSGVRASVAADLEIEPMGEPGSWSYAPVAFGGEVYVLGSGGVWASVDEGRTFAARSGDGPGFYFLGVSGDSLVGAEWGPRQLVRSTDRGRTWTTLAEAPPPGPAVSELVEVGDAIVVAHYRGISRTTDSGATWAEVALAPELGVPHELLVNPEGVIFAASRGHGVLRSRDGGATWERTGLVGLPVSSLALRDGVLYAGIGAAGGDAGGVRFSRDGGTTWADLAPFAERVSSLAATESGLVIATFDSGVWTAALTLR